MKRGAIVGLVVGAVVLVAAGGGLAWWLLSRPASPADVAARYVRALADGDAKTALAQVDADQSVRDAAATAYSDGVTMLTDPEVGTSTQNGERASVEVDYTLAGERVSITLALQYEEERWLVTRALASVTVRTTVGDAARVGALDVATGDEVAVLPGVYRVVPLPSELLTGETSFVATPGDAATATVESALTPEATAAAQQQLDVHAQACAQPATAVPPNCGLRVPWGADLTALTSIGFRIEKTPQVVLSPDATSFAATGGVIVATARGPSRSGGDGVFTYRADDWSFYGSVSFDGGQMVLAVR